MFSMCWACWAGVRLEQILCWAYPGKWENEMNTGHPGLKRDPANTGGIPPQPCPVPLPATPKPYPVLLPDLTVPFSYNSKYGINMGKQTGGNGISSVHFYHYWQVRPTLPGAAGPTPCHVLGPKRFLPRMHNLDERDLSRKCRFNRMDEVVITWINGSTSPTDQPPQSSFQEHHEHHQAKAVHPTA
jgi:hypothetical protein